MRDGEPRSLVPHKYPFDQGADWAYEFLQNDSFWGRTCSRLQLKNKALTAEAEALAEVIEDWRSKLPTNSAYDGSRRVYDKALSRWRAFKKERGE